MDCIEMKASTMAKLLKENYSLPQRSKFFQTKLESIEPEIKRTGLKLKKYISNKIKRKFIQQI